MRAQRYKYPQPYIGSRVITAVLVLLENHADATRSAKLQWIVFGVMSSELIMQRDV